MSDLLAYSLVAFIFVNCCSVECAKILAVFPYPDAAQYYTVKPYLEELTSRGHEVFLICHQFPGGKLPDIKLTFEDYDALLISEIPKDTKRPQEDSEEDTAAARDTESRRKNFRADVTRSVLENEQVQQLLKNESAAFDLMIVDVLMPSAIFAMAEHFEAHLIGFSREATELHIDSFTGNESPKSYLPVSTVGRRAPKEFFVRLYNLQSAFIEWLTNVFASTSQEKMYRQHFPKMRKTLDEIYGSFALILVNQHFSFGLARPYVPNIKQVGGLFMSAELETIPPDVLHFIESAEEAVIYFSLGANIQLSLLPNKKLEVISAFVSNLKHRILWKVDFGKKMNITSNNVMAREWFPQRAILAHPKVALFITHGGYLSILEAIVYGKPILGIPILQHEGLNMQLVEQYDIGLRVNFGDLTQKVLQNAFSEVLNNGRYLENVQELRSRYLDRLTKPLDLAVFWTEYILRHDGAEFMRVPGRLLCSYEYFNLDVYCTIFFCAVILCGSLLFLLKQTRSVVESLTLAAMKRWGGEDWLEEEPEREPEPAHEPGVHKMPGIHNPNLYPNLNPRGRGRRRSTVQ